MDIFDCENGPIIIIMQYYSHDMDIRLINKCFNTTYFTIYKKMYNEKIYFSKYKKYLKFAVHHPDYFDYVLDRTQVLPKIDVFTLNKYNKIICKYLIINKNKDIVKKNFIFYISIISIDKYTKLDIEKIRNILNITDEYCKFNEFTQYLSCEDIYYIFIHNYKIYKKTIDYSVVYKISNYFNISILSITTLLDIDKMMMIDEHNSIIIKHNRRYYNSDSYYNSWNYFIDCLFKINND